MTPGIGQENFDTPRFIEGNSRLSFGSQISDNFYTPCHNDLLNIVNNELA